MIFPDLTSDFMTGGNENQNARALINYAVYYHMGRKFNIDKLENLYNSFNGILEEKQYEYIFKSSGKISRTKYRKYMLGRTKMKQLHGEFLQINLGATARVSNPEAVNKKMQEINFMKSLSKVKPQIEQLRQSGFNIFPGVNIPDQESDFLDPRNFKTTNEMVTQEIINDKLRTQNFKSKFYSNFVDVTVSSMCYGKIERTSDGVDTFRPINPRYALFIEMDDDPFIQRSPFKGELRYMFEYEVYKMFPDLTKDDRERVRGMRGTIDDIARNRLMNIQGHELLYPVYTLEWIALEPVYIKITKVPGSEVPYKIVLTQQEYNKQRKKIEYDVKNGRYEIMTQWRGNLFQGHRIGKMVYTGIGPTTDFALSRNEDGKLWPRSNYEGLLFDTVDGERVSMQQIISNLEDVYDHIRFLINKELGKFKGNILGWDDAYKPRGVDFKDLYHTLSEDGVIRLNSSAEGNQSQRDANLELFLKQIDLGPTQSLAILIQQARDVEMTMDRITGMSSDRSGLSLASQTATANTNNIEASRSMTYAIFWFFQEYIKNVLKSVIDKTRINKSKLGLDNRAFVYSEDQNAYIMATQDYSNEDYALYISDGKREFDIQSKLEQFFVVDINSGKLATKDIAKYYMQDNFSRAMKVLEDAWNTATNIELGQQQQQQNSMMQVQQQKDQAKQAAQKEAEQAKLDQIALQSEGKKEQIQLKGEIDHGIEVQNGINKLADTHAQNYYDSSNDGQESFNQ